MGEAVLLYAMAASSAVSMMSSMGQAEAAKKAAALERQQAEDDAAVARIQAMDEEAIRRKDLNATLASQRAQAAALGFEPSGSRSFMALQKDTEKTAERDITNIRFMGSYKNSRSLLKGQIAAAEGSMAAAAHTTQAVTSAFSAGNYAYKGYKAK